MFLDKRIIRQFGTVIRFNALAEFFHHPTVRFHIFVVEPEHPRSKYSSKNRRLLDNDDRFIGTSCSYCRRDSGRRPTDDHHVVIMILFCSDRRVFRCGEQEAANQESQ